jgi:solute carrier family 25, member 42
MKRGLRRTKTEMDNLRFIFDRVDANEDGRIKRVLFEDLLVQFGISNNIIEAHMRLEKAGLSSQDYISFCEFVTVVEEWGEKASKLRGIDVEIETGRWADNLILIDESGTIFEPKQSNVPQVSDRYSVIPTWMLNEESLKKLVAGGLAGILAKSCVAPADRVKILFQVHSGKHFSIRNAFKEASAIVSQDGARSLWRGNSATVLRVFPYAGLQFLTFDLYSSFLKSTRPEDKNDAYFSEYWRLQLERLASGALCGATSVAATYPLDFLRARMAVQNTLQGETCSVLRTLKTVISEDGCFGLYRGMLPTLYGILPYAGFAFLGFNWMKSAIEKRERRDLLMWERVLCGSVSGLIAQSISYPLDTVRRRMQTERVVHGNSGTSRYVSILGTLKYIKKTEGVRGMFKGFTMNWLKGPFAVGISFAANDFFRGKLGVSTRKND